MCPAGQILRCEAITGGIAQTAETFKDAGEAVG